MLFKLTFDVVHVDGSKMTVTTRPATEVAFERRFGRTLASLFTSAPFDKAQGDDVDVAAFAQWFGESFRSEWTYFLAHHASRTALDFDAWLDTVDAIEWRFAEQTDPTRPVPSAS